MCAEDQGAENHELVGNETASRSEVIPVKCNVMTDNITPFVLLLPLLAWVLIMMPIDTLHFPPMTM